MQVWDDLRIFLLISFSCIVVQFALLYPTVGGFFCAGDLNENQPQRKLYETDIEKNNSTEEKEQELTNKCLTPLPKLNAFFSEGAGLSIVACPLLFSTSKFWLGSTPPLCKGRLSGTPTAHQTCWQKWQWYLHGHSDLGVNDSIHQRLEARWNSKLYGFLPAANVSFCRTSSICMNVELNTAKLFPSWVSARAEIICDQSDQCKKWQ